LEIKEIGILATIGVAAAAFLFMPQKPSTANLLTTNKTAYASGSNEKHQIESDAAVMAAAVGIKGPAAKAPVPKPTPPAPTPPKPHRPFLPWRGEEGPDDQAKQPEAARIDLEALLKPVEPQPKAPTQGNCANGNCYQPARRGFRWR